MAMCIGAGLSIQAQELSKTDSLGKDLREVVIKLPFANAYTPMTFSNLNHEKIEKLNYGQDVPFVLRDIPSLVMTSDAGTGIGYTGLWIRGSDPSRINVTINDIPLNDPESQQVFWVNLPDFVSSTDDIQVQRGVGTSTNGVASFGGTIRMNTLSIQSKPYLRVNTGGGSFNTLRNTVAFGTGIKNGFLFEGRLSRISSDGYIDRASARLTSYFISGTYLSQKTTVKLTSFGGQERTYQAWYGTPVSRLIGNRDSMLVFASNNFLSEAQTTNLLQSDRRYNFYTYDNQVDNYAQTHYQLHVSHRFNPRLQLTSALHYTRGLGHFEEFRGNADYSDYGLIAPSDSITATDIVRKRWLDNHFYGGVFSLNYENKGWNLSFGGAANQYLGDHYGNITWMQFADTTPKDFEYYRGESKKNDGNVYLRSYYNIKDKLTLYADIQGRLVQYKTAGLDNDLRAYNVNDDLLFFNPKIGLSFFKNEKEKFYLSAAIGNKEPNRNDYVDAPEGITPKPESMIDFEAGYGYSNKKIQFKANVYYMQYKDQLVLTGELNDVGAPLRTNVDNSFRRGIELETEWKPSDKWLLTANAALSQNRIKQFDEVLYDYTTGFDVVKIRHENTSIAFSPSVIVGGRAEWFFHKNISIAWLPRYVGKQYLDNTQSEYLTLPAYFVNDAAIRWNKRTMKDQRITIQLMVNNTLNELYSSNGYTFSYIFEQRITEKFFYPQAERFFLASIQFEL